MSTKWVIWFKNDQAVRAGARMFCWQLHFTFKDLSQSAKCELWAVSWGVKWNVKFTACYDWWTRQWTRTTQEAKRLVQKRRFYFQMGRFGTQVVNQRRQTLRKHAHYRRQGWNATEVLATRDPASHWPSPHMFHMHNLVHLEEPAEQYM